MAKFRRKPKKMEIRRYNFIVGQSCLYSGLFQYEGLFGGILLKVMLQNMRIQLCVKYKIPINCITISNTIKDKE